jgi:hypothetical protein
LILIILHTKLKMWITIVEFLSFHFWINLQMNLHQEVGLKWLSEYQWVQILNYCSFWSD